MRCPACGSDGMLPILRGFPSPESVAAAERGELLLGGCMVSDNDPTHGCPVCRHEIQATDPAPEAG